MYGSVFKDTTRKEFKEYGICTYSVHNGDNGFDDAVLIKMSEYAQFELDLKAIYGDHLMKVNIHPVQRLELK